MTAKKWETSLFSLRALQLIGPTAIIRVTEEESIISCSKINFQYTVDHRGLHKTSAVSEKPGFFENISFIFVFE